MLPIYSDLLKMWSDLGYDLPIKEGKYWLENNFIQAFTRDGTLRKLWKYKVFDDLHIEITPYHNKIKFLTYLCILISNEKFVLLYFAFNLLFAPYNLLFYQLPRQPKTNRNICYSSSHKCRYPFRYNFYPQA